MASGLQTAEQRKTAPHESPERERSPEQEQLAPDKGLEGSRSAGPMDSEKAPHRPVQAKGEVDLAGASSFMKEVAGNGGAAGAQQKPLGPAPEPKGLDTKGSTDGGMDSADGGGGADAEPPPSPTPDAGGGGGAPAAPTPPPDGGGGGGSAAGGGSGGGAGSPAGAGPAVDGGGGGKGKGSDSATGRAAEQIFGAKPSAFIEGYRSIGATLTEAKKQDEAKGFEKMPTLKAVLPDDAQAAAEGKPRTPRVDERVTDGVQGDDAPLPAKGNEKPQEAPKQRVSGADEAKMRELSSVMEHLKSFFSSMISDIDTQPKVRTDPGQPPPVRMEGQADPARGAVQEQDAGSRIDEAHAGFAKAIDDGPGPQDVHRQPMEEAIPPEKLPDIDIAEQQISDGMAYYESMTITPQERAAADDLLAPTISAKMEKADTQLQESLDQQETERDQAIADAEKQTLDLNTSAQAEQEEIVARTKKEIDAEQKKTKKAQQDEVKKAKKRGDKERRQVEKQVADRQVQDDRRIKDEFKRAKKEAEGEKTKAEKKAEDEKRKAEEKKKNQSWWDRVKSAVSDVVNAVCKVIGGIFDLLGKLVSGIINAVKDLACGIIDLACKFAKGLLDGLGKLLKGLVSALLGQIFPELAKKLNEYIDKGVALAKKGVEVVGDTLKKGVEAVASTVNGVVQKGLQIVKTGITTAVRVAGCIATGDFEGAFLQVFYGACEIAGLSRADAEALLGKTRDTLKKIVDHPIDFIKNLISAGAGGFKKFASGFVGYLKKAFIEWIVGPLAAEGLEIPKEWNVVGIFKMVASLLGITRQWAFGLVEKKLGSKAKKALEKATEYIEAFMQDGIAGVWEKIKSDVGDLWTMLLDFVLDFVKSKIVTFAAEKLASLLAGPIGALWQVIKTAYNIYTTIRDKLDKIKSVVMNLFGAVSDIANGVLGGAIDKVVEALVSALGIAIDLLAKIAGIGDLPKKIRKFIEGLQAKVRGAIEKVIDKVVSKIKGLFKGGDDKEDKDAKGKGKDKDKDKDAKGQLPPPRTFTSQDGHQHKLWADKQGPKATIMVASTPMPVKQKVQEWRGTLKEQPKEVRGKAGSLIGKAIAIEKAGDAIAEKILKGEAKAEDLSHKLAEAEAPMAELFGILEGAGAGKIDPLSTLASEKYGTFKGQFCEIAREVEMTAGAPKEAERIWVLTVTTILKKDTKGRFAKEKEAGGGRADLESQAMKDIMADLTPITAALRKYMKAHAAKNEKGTWAFWSGKPADPVARKNCKMSLEKSALGKVFDGVNIDGSWNTELWATLSQSYATFAAKSFEGKEFRGFVGHGSKADQSIFNKIEQPTFKMLTATVKAKPALTFFAVAGKKDAKGRLEPDWSKSAGPCTGVFAQGERAAMVAQAEEYNEKILKGEDPGAGGKPDDDKKGGSKKKAEAKDVPSESYQDATGETHSIYVEGDKGKVEVMHASVPQALRVIAPRGDTYAKAADVETATNAYLALPATASDADRKNALKAVRKAMKVLRKAMETARGDRKKIVKQRTAMEKLLGKRAMTTYKQSKAAADDMAQKTLKFFIQEVKPSLDISGKIDSKFLRQIEKDPAIAGSFKKMVEATGMSLSSGFAGAVDKKYAKIKKALLSGNLRVKVQHVINFGDQFAKKVFDPTLSEAALRSALDKITANSAATQAVLDRKAEIESPTATRDPHFGKDSKDAKGLLGDTTGGDGEFYDAKNMPGAAGKPHEMDTKLPGVPLAALKYDELYALARSLDFAGEHGEKRSVLETWCEGKLGSKTTPKGGGQPMSRSRRRLDDPNVRMSTDEKKGVGLNAGAGSDIRKLLPFSEGVAANLIDPNHWWIDYARKLDMPLKAGISGTAHRWMNQAKMMGANLPGARLAIYGQLIPIAAHSYHEISAAARAHVPYTDGKYLPLPPLSEEEVRSLAKGAGAKSRADEDLLLGLT